MPRGPRLDAPGAIHHVLLRGLDRQRIFQDDEDRADFVARLAQQLENGAADCFAWALMPNHVHLMLRTGSTPLSRIMARVNTGYARWHNRRHARTGYLFENRFKSILVEEDGYLRNLVRYVHRNPLRDGLVDSLAELARYRWCGHAALLRHSAREFEAVDEVLSWFGSDPDTARRELLAWMGEPGVEDASARPGDAAPGSAQCARGWTEPEVAPFDPRSRRRASTNATSRLQRQRLRHHAGWEIVSITRWVCTQFGADEKAVLGGRRDARSSTARAVIAHLATFELGLPGRQVATDLGIGAGALSRAARRGARLAGRYEMTLCDEGPTPSPCAE